MRYGGFDMEFSASLDNLHLAIATNVAATVTKQGKNIRFYLDCYDMKTVRFAVRDEDSVLLYEDEKEISEFPLEGTDYVRFRVFMFDRYVSVSADGATLFVCVFLSADYPPDNTTVALSSPSGTVVTDFVLAKLGDGREAIYVDYETAAGNAISDVIQQRPVELRAGQDGRIKALVDYVNNEVPKNFKYFWKVNASRQLPPNLSSDGIVYYEDVLGISSEDVFAEFGYGMTLYRMSELSTGVRLAVETIQRKALESASPVSAMGRFDYRFEQGDVLALSVEPYGGRPGETIQLLIEDISFRVQDGMAQAEYVGRAV